MNIDYIKIVQNTLIAQGNHATATLLDDSYCEDYKIDNWNGGIGKVVIYVHPNNFLAIRNVDDNTYNILLQIFNGLPFEYYEIELIEFRINTDIKIENTSDIIYIFVDEAGDMDFSPKGSKHYMFNFLIKRRPFKLHENIANFRYSLLERNLSNPSNRLDIERFHACEDNKYIREKLFKIISTFDENLVKIYSYVLEKPKVKPDKRNQKDKFYIENLSYAIKKLLDELKIDKSFIIITDRLPIDKNKKQQIGALKKGIKEYLKQKNLQIRYDIFHHASASSTNLQIVDYVSWAIFRKFEHKEDFYFKNIEKYLMKIEEPTKTRKELHY